MKLLFVRTLAALIAAVVMLVAGAIPANAAQQDDVVSLTNSHRTTAGLPPLTRERTLDAAAQQWAEEMSRTKVFTHSSNDWRAARIPAGWETHGENIAYGYGSAATAMNGWMASAGHKQNILRSSFTHIGVGYVASGNYWVQIFAGYSAENSPTKPPFGSFDIAGITVSGSTATIAAGGWAIDGGARETSSQVHVYVTDPAGKQSGYAITADGSRPDVGNAYPGAGPAHGFAWSTPVAKVGNYRVCAFAIGKSANVGLGCKTVSFGPGRPFGSVDDVSVRYADGAASIALSGWAMDDALRSVSTDVHVYVTAPDGRVDGYAVPATSQRADVGAVYPGAGNTHGFSRSIPITRAGSYQVCVYAIAAPIFGGNNQLTCRSVSFGPTAPIGSVDELAVKIADSGAVLSLSGWTLDNGLRSVSTQVHAYVTDPSGVTAGYAIPASNNTRSDVAAAYPGAGAAHGFAQSIPIAMSGAYQVCVYGISAPIFDGNNQLACRSVNLGPGSPSGSFDTVSIDGARNVTASGWALDNALRSASTTVKLVLTAPDGSVRETVVDATGTRTDVGQAFLGAGAQHGFTASVAAPGAGSYTACIQVSTARSFGGGYTALTCKPVTIPG